MPYSRKLRRRYGRKVKKFFRKSGRATRKPAGVRNKYRRTKVRIPTRVLPDYTLVRMKCSTTFELPAGTTPSVGTYSFVNTAVYGNDIFDPFINFSTDQPNGFDQWMTFYQNFIVHKSSIKVTPIYWNTDPIVSGGLTLPFQLIIVPMANQNLPSGLTTDYSEFPYSTSRLYTGALPVSNGTSVVYSPTPGQISNPSLSNSMMTKKILGYKDLSDVDEVRGTATSSPTALFLYRIFVKSMVPGAGSTLTNYRLSPLGIRVDMYFKCQLLNRINVQDSAN